EQEISRAVAHRRALGDGARPVLRKVAPVAAGITVALVAGVALASARLTADLFEGTAVVTIALAIALVGYAPFHLARGMCSGMASFRTYSVMIALDGLVRVVLAGAFLVAGIDRVGPYALMVALVPLAIAVTVFVTGRVHSDEGSPATWSELAPNLGWLLVGTLFAGALINAGPLTVDILGANNDPAQVTRFANAVLLARVPLFLFQAVQAAMLPRLTRRSRHRRSRRGVCGRPMGARARVRRRHRSAHHHPARVFERGLHARPGVCPVGVVDVRSRACRGWLGREFRHVRGNGSMVE
ncbi:MAG: hypothetical protein EBT17_04250, partial [Actinobacteria bacterium]|nr:hypothetical protein [Actinomycetota bacterium]